MGHRAYDTGAVPNLRRRGSTLPKVRKFKPRHGRPGRVGQRGQAEDQEGEECTRQERHLLIPEPRTGVCEQLRN